MIDHAIAIRVAICNGADLCCVALDDDAVAFFAVEVGDRVMADLIDPMVVDVGVLASHPVPSDGAVILCVFLDEAFLGIDQGLEVEDVSAGASGEHIVCRDRLIGIELAVCELIVRVGFITVRIIGHRSLAAISLGDQQIVAGPAVEHILAMAAVEHIIAFAAIEVVIAVSALQDVIAAATIDGVIAKTCIDGIGPFGSLDGLAGIGALCIGGSRCQLAVFVEAEGCCDGPELIGAPHQLLEGRHQVVLCKSIQSCSCKRWIDFASERCHVFTGNLLVKDHDIGDGAVELL
ncbi:hypothetical protein LP7551_01337 [Roseibium album]|nr:hypothetical protein LP7551_01337 [Roseibium album]